MTRWREGPVLGVETSCDETSAAVLVGDRVAGHVIASQDAHARFGGVVPEIAARAHLRQLDAVVRGALEEAGVAPSGLAGVGVTAGPGLVGALLVGVNWAKSFAWALGVPVVGIHHMEGHLFAVSLEEPRARPPFIALLVSGGHTMLLHVEAWGRYRLLGQTRDDAVGEAFDKVARRLGLGFPGGPEIERRARDGRPGRFTLPRPMLSGRERPGDPGWLDFSFAGLKTAAALLAAEVETEGPRELEEATPDLAAEFQTAAVEVLAEKTRRATELTGCRRVVLGGGVARNAALRAGLEAALGAGAEVYGPSPRLATDNAAMIARAAQHRLRSGERSGLELNADPNLPLPGLAVGPEPSGGGSRVPSRTEATCTPS